MFATALATGTPPLVSPGKMYAELKRSVEMYPKLESVEDASTYVVKLATIYQKQAIFVINGRIFAFPRFTEASKHRKHAFHILSTLEKNAVENVAYGFERDSTGNWSTFGTKFPFAAIAKKRGYESPGILVPNPFFGDASGNLTSWGTRLAALPKFGAVQDQRVFWRGNVGHHEEFDCDRDDGNYARFSAVSLTVERPDIFNVKCNKCHPNNGTSFFAQRCGHPHYDASMITLLKNPKLALLGYDPQWYDVLKEYPKYRVLLNLPGTTAGGYSRNLNLLWFLGRVVFFWRAPFVEFYHVALVPGLTHLVVNKTNAVPAYTALDSTTLHHHHHHEFNETLEQRLVRGAKAVAEDLVCASCLIKFYAAFFAAIRRRFNLGLVLDDPERLADLFDSARVNCAEDFVEILPNPDVIKDPISPLKNHFVVEKHLVPVGSPATCHDVFRAIFDHPNTHFSF